VETDFSRLITPVTNARILGFIISGHIQIRLHTFQVCGQTKWQRNSHDYIKNPGATYSELNRLVTKKKSERVYLFVIVRNESSLVTWIIKDKIRNNLSHVDVA
jgi:hypothetical protein